jgi:hypothetical protein
MLNVTYIINAITIIVIVIIIIIIMTITAVTIVEQERITFYVRKEMRRVCNISLRLNAYKW